MAKIYEDYDEAARASQHKKAISKKTYIAETFKDTRRLKVMKPLGGEPVFVYASAQSLECKEIALPYSLVDKIDEWEAF